VSQWKVIQLDSPYIVHDWLKAGGRLSLYR
jgi:hypothetical protein